MKGALILVFTVLITIVIVPIALILGFIRSFFSRSRKTFIEAEKQYNQLYKAIWKQEKQ